VSRTPCNSYRLYLTGPETYSSCGCATKNIQFSSKNPVTMNSLFPGTFPHTIRSFINSWCSSCILITSRAYALLVACLMISYWSSFSLRALSKFPVHKIDTCHTMETPQNIIRGTWSNISARLEPKTAWDSFLLVAGIPEVSKGGSYMRMETLISHRVKAKVEEVVTKGRTLKYMPPQQ